MIVLMSLLVFRATKLTSFGLLVSSLPATGLVVAGLSVLTGVACGQIL